MAKIPGVAIVLLLVQLWPAAAADSNCMNDYYRTKPADCVDSILSQLRTAPTGKSDPSTVIGFLAQLFVRRPRRSSAFSPTSLPTTSGRWIWWRSTAPA